MNQFGKRFGVVVFALSFILLAFGVQAQEEVEVKVAAPPPAVASHSHDHNITVGSIKRGKREYTLQNKAEDRHQINLTRTQRADLLDGTAVIIRSSKDENGGDLKEHQHRVTITYQGEEKESYGW